MLNAALERADGAEDLAHGVHRKGGISLVHKSVITITHVRRMSHEEEDTYLLHKRVMTVAHVLTLQCSMSYEEEDTYLMHKRVITIAHVLTLHCSVLRAAQHPTAII